MIKINNLSHSLGGNPVLENVSFSLAPSSVTGLIGINGAGKTTLMRLIASVYTPDSGEITFEGKRIDLPEVKEKIFFLPDDPYYNHRTTGYELFSMYKHFYPSADWAAFAKS